MSDRESPGHTFLSRLRSRAARRSDPVDSAEISARGTEIQPMVDPSDVHTSEAVRRSADERIRREAIRQLDSIDLDSDDARIEPLPAFKSSGLFTDVVVEHEENPGDEVAWDEVAGRFAPEDDILHRP